MFFFSFCFSFEKESEDCLFFFDIFLDSWVLFVFFELHQICIFIIFGLIGWMDCEFQDCERIKLIDWVFSKCNFRHEWIPCLLSFLPLPHHITPFEPNYEKKREKKNVMKIDLNFGWNIKVIDLKKEMRKNSSLKTVDQMTTKNYKKPITSSPKQKLLLSLINIII